MGLAMLFGPACSALAQEGWNPFEPRGGQVKERRPRPSEAVPSGPPLPPMRERSWERQAPPLAAPPGSVERSELAPIMAPDNSGLPLDLWRGLDLAALEGLLAGLDLPPRSPALHQLWRRMLLSQAEPPVGAPGGEHFQALRLEALYRSGLLADMAAVLEGIAQPGPIVQTLRARRDIGLGQREAGCEAIKALAAPSSGLPGRLKGEMQLLAGYCAAAAGDAQAAGLAAQLAREEGIDAELPLAVLTAFGAGDKPRLSMPKQVLLLDYRFLELLGPVDPLKVLERAEPALLAMLAGDTGGDPKMQVAAAEAALRRNALAPEAVAEVYRRQVLAGPGVADPASPGIDPLLRRALFLRAADVAPTAAQRARFLRAILDDARRSGARLQTGRLVAPLIAGLAPAPDLAWLTEPAIEALLVAGDIDAARRWAEAASRWDWLALADVVDPQRRGGRLPSLAAVADLAAHGRLAPDPLHRLATVLDALDVDVPIPLWEAASRTPQPAGGFLPETGLLASLAEASARKEAGRTILLAMRALGPGGPEGANPLALGDAVRALKRVGLEADARRVALEALLAAWPRAAAN